MKKPYLLLLLSLLIQCKPERPEGVLDEKTYQSVLKEIILVNQLKQTNEIKDKKAPDYLALVYKKYRIDSLQLKKTTDYYSEHPEILVRIYQKLEAEFKSVSDSLEPLKKQEKIKTDQIKLLKKKVDLKNLKK